MSSLPKPVLRGHVLKHAIKSVALALGFAAFNASAFYFLKKVPYEKNYEEFMKNYDPMKHYEDLVKWGYLVTHKDNYYEGDEY